jgi:hypothetical protein
MTPIYRDSLPGRRAALAGRLRELSPSVESVLLLNATKGPALYPSVVDFFVVLREVHPDVTVVSASYFFDEIHALARGVAEKGLRSFDAERVAQWEPGRFAAFDLIIAFGPSTLLFRLMALEGLRSRLVMLDLGHYHELIAATGGRFLSRAYASEQRSLQCQRLTLYSCQPASKLTDDLGRCVRFELLELRWFDYIPAGLGYLPCYRSEHKSFDVGLLGHAGRDIAIVDFAALRGTSWLVSGFEPSADSARQLEAHVGLTLLPRVDEDEYARHLALCRCVLIPLAPKLENVMLSALDALASGVPLLVTRRPGFARLAALDAPILFFDTREELTAVVRSLLADPARQAALSEQSIEFTRRQLDIYWILERVVRENA